MSDLSDSRTTDATLTRRGFLGASGAIGAAGLLPGRAGALFDSVAKNERAEVVVVGAGLAGLATARFLHDEGVEVLVLEAEGQVGGRLGVEEPGVLGVDTAVPATHQSVLGLAKALGVPTRDAAPPGEWRLTIGGVPQLVAAESLSGDPDLDREVGVALRRLNLMAAEVDPEVPWAASNALERDRVSVGSWMDDNVGSDLGRKLFTLVVRSIWAAEPVELSLLHALTTIAGAGGLGPLVNVALAPGWVGPQLLPADGSEHGTGCRAHRRGSCPSVSVPRPEKPIDRFVIEGGALAIVGRLVRHLREHVRVAAPVRRVTQDDKKVIVEGEEFSVEAQHVVVALPPSAAGRVAFAPDLSPDQRAATRSSGGDVVSVVCTYGPAFTPGGVGVTRAAEIGGPLTVAEVGRESATATVVGRACGAAARRWQQSSAEERRAVALRAIGRWFGPSAEQPLGYSERDWRDTLSGAAWSTVASPGAAITVARGLRAAHGRVRWAGTERSAAWAGWLEGAVQSGERAARSVLADATRAPLHEVLS